MVRCAWHRGLLAAIDALETFPEACPKAPENEHFEEEIRQRIYKRRGRSTYRLLFTIQGRTLHLLHVRHGARRALGEEPIEDVSED